MKPPIPPPKEATTFNPQDYADLIDDPNLTEEEKTEALEAIWSILVQFIWLGFDIHPLQQARESSDNFSTRRDYARQNEPDLLDSTDWLDPEILLNFRPEQDGPEEGGCHASE